jgi:hypothetical protein
MKAFTLAWTLQEFYWSALLFYSTSIFLLSCDTSVSLPTPPPPPPLPPFLALNDSAKTDDISHRIKILEKFFFKSRTFFLHPPFTKWNKDLPFYVASGKVSEMMALLKNWLLRRGILFTSNVRQRQQFDWNTQSKCYGIPQYKCVACNCM